MGYKYSKVDEDNLGWFLKDNACATLSKIEMREGYMRGLKPFEMHLAYPISAVAGENGSGKSTLLAIACCGYHNNREGFKPLSRKVNYYTFNDFFIQSPSDEPLYDIEIWVPAGGACGGCLRGHTECPPT